jgi:hypothetical protein
MPAYAFVDGECVPVTYGGCMGNGNRFETLSECMSYCEGGPVPNGCRAEHIAAEICIACSAAGGCDRELVCAEPCQTESDCAIPTFRCLEGVCQAWCTE